jgi:ELWxxDGT repeat protein
MAVLLALLGSGITATPVAASTGPYRVKDINSAGSSNPIYITDLNGIAYFNANGGGKGAELWRSDGTAQGTTRVRDIRPGSAGSNPAWLATVNGQLYFQASDGIAGREIWTSDGTSIGTRLVKDLRPGSKGSDPHCFTAFNGAVYFWADTGPVGYELWRTDGTAAGTVQIKDIEPGADGYNWCPVSFAGRLFFVHSSDNAAGDDTLYISNGTATGTKPFKNSTGHQVHGLIENLTVVGSRLFFLKDGDLWRTDGTAATTRKISSIEGGIIGLDGTAYIVFDTQTIESATGHIWKSNGTSATTTHLVDVPGGIAAALLAAAGSNLFFDADSDNGMPGLGVSDGTSSGTESLNVPVAPEGGVALGSVLYFFGYDLGDNQPPTQSTCSFTCRTIWRSDGTSVGTQNLGLPESLLDDIAVVGNSIYFTSDEDGHGQELWRYVP